MLCSLDICFIILIWIILPLNCFYGLIKGRWHFFQTQTFLFIYLFIYIEIRSTDSYNSSFLLAPMTINYELIENYTVLYPTFIAVTVIYFL